MARKNKNKTDDKKEGSTYGEPKYPYSITPNSLRRLLEIIPSKPKPPQITGSTLKVWGFKNTNDHSVLRVLKAIGFLSASGDPTNFYVDYMKKDSGPAMLGQRIKTVYGDLFNNVANPEKATDDELKSFFNIHSGGKEGTIRFQVETFKALANYATFGISDPLSQDRLLNNGEIKADQSKSSEYNHEPIIRIDLHIHLPENKSKSDYDAIMESIANHLYKKK